MPQPPTDVHSSSVTPVPTPDLSKRWGQRLAIALLGAVLVYLVLALWAGAGDVWQALRVLPPWRLGVALLALFCSYNLLFWRWRWVAS